MYVSGSTIFHFAFSPPFLKLEVVTPQGMKT